jgi:hypothetical protein
LPVANSWILVKASRRQFDADKVHTLEFLTWSIILIVEHLSPCFFFQNFPFSKIKWLMIFMINFKCLFLAGGTLFPVIGEYFWYYATHSAGNTIM